VKLREQIAEEFPQRVWAFYLLAVVFPVDDETIPEQTSLRLDKELLLERQFAVDEPQQDHQLQLHAFGLGPQEVEAGLLEHTNPHP
jgi:hypothetical protein